MPYSIKLLTTTWGGRERREREHILASMAAKGAEPPVRAWFEESLLPCPAPPRGAHRAAAPFVPVLASQSSWNVPANVRATECDVALTNSLSSLLLCPSAEALRHTAGWRGAEGGSRAELLEWLVSLVSPAAAVPSGRLEGLVTQVR